MIFLSTSIDAGDCCWSCGSEGLLFSIVALDGCAQFSGWKFIFTGDTGECPNREPSGMGTRGSCVWRAPCGDDGSEVGFRLMGMVLTEPL